MKTFGARGKRTWNEDPLAFKSIPYRHFKSNVLLRGISLSLLFPLCATGWDLSPCFQHNSLLSPFECYWLSLYLWLLTYQSRWLYAVLTTAFLPFPLSPLKAWSITYHSWLTFVLLIWSCTLWMIRNRRKYAMISSPFMVVYANLLLVLQYIWSFELPEIKKVPGFLEKKEPGELASKVSD